MKVWTIASGLLLTVAAGAAVGFWYGQSRTPSPPPPPVALAEPEPEVVDRREVPSSTASAPAPAIAAAPVESQWIALNREAIASLEAGEIDHAIELFEQCVAGEPAQPTYRHNLAEALVRRALVDHEVQRPCPLCIERLARAVELAPERDALRELLARWRLEADTEKEFWTEGSQHFDLAYEGWRSEIIASSQSILDELERAYLDLAERFGVHPGELGAPRISVVLYRPAEFHSLTGLGHWAGAAFDGRIRVPI
jgi:tetratricopeptide (TPR) repeat protein